jgi:hypothetical protein
VGARPALGLTRKGIWMGAFEELVAEILWMDGHWVRTSVKVELTKEEKRKIGRPWRWELDIVVQRARQCSPGCGVRFARCPGQRIQCGIG